MKTFNKAVILLLLFTMICGLCFAAPKKRDTLDAAIRETSDYLNSNIAKGSKIVILNIQSESGALSEYIIDELISNTVNDRVFLVVDRQQLDAIRAEQNFQFSGEVDDKQAMEIGKFFGAQTIVSGAMGPYGKDYRLRIRALEVQTALVQGQFNKNITKSKAIPTLLASKPSGTTTATTSSNRQNTSTSGASGGNQAANTRGITIINNSGAVMELVTMYPYGSTNTSDLHYFVRTTNPPIQNGETKRFDLPHFNASNGYTVTLRDTAKNHYDKSNLQISQGMVLTFTPEDLTRKAAQSYKIGDTGPAGGIIFYDKGTNSGGWRYLEAAPVEAEFQAVWTLRDTKVENLQESIGSGRRNTQLITDTFSKASGEWDTAAQKCTELNFGGYNDWFLPSRDELDQMYGQLKRRNLGDFKNEWYMSSSSNTVWLRIQNFGNGGQDHTRQNNYRNNVRPIRQVAGPAN